MIFIPTQILGCQKIGLFHVRNESRGMRNIPRGVRNESCGMRKMICSRRSKQPPAEQVAFKLQNPLKEGKTNAVPPSFLPVPDVLRTSLSFLHPSLLYL